MFAEILLIGIIVCLISAAGTIFYMRTSGPKAAAIRPMPMPRYRPVAPVGHVHEAGSFSAAAKGWYCDTPLEDGRPCGLHKHVYYETGKCACGAEGKPGFKEWSPE